MCACLLCCFVSRAVLSVFVFSVAFQCLKVVLFHLDWMREMIRLLTLLTPFSASQFKSIHLGPRTRPSQDGEVKCIPSFLLLHEILKC